MRQLRSFLFLCVSLFASGALAAPGSYWEIGMEMEGMPFALPKQKVCTPKDDKEPPVSSENDECRILEKNQSGNRFRWKAECKEGTMLGDVTSTPNSYSGSMKMTDKSGQTMAMKMSGKRLGPCEYKDRSGEFKALQKQGEDAMTKNCQLALDEMQGQMLGDQCPKEKALFCQRLATPEGYDKATRNLPFDMLEDEKLGAPAVTRLCKLNNAKLLPKLCTNAVSGSNFSFVSRLCPNERPKLCTQAAAAGKLNYVGGHCPAEKAALIQENCAGRKYSSDIEPRFANFCANAANASGGNWTDEPARADNKPTTRPHTSDAAREAVTESVQKGYKQLKGLFGF